MAFRPLRGVYRFCKGKEIYISEPTPIQLRARQDDIMLKKKIARQYMMLGCAPTSNKE